MHFKPLFILGWLISFSCNNEVISSGNLPRFNNNKFHLVQDIDLPTGYKRIETGDFANFLRHTGIKEDHTVYLFNGTPKTNQSAQFAVLDISVGPQDLQQCADAVMRMRAEYLYAAKEFDQIIFTDNNGKAYKFNAPYTRENFSRYLQQVFGRCGSASLAKQLKPVKDFSKIEPGDVLIRGGFPGHAVIVMDMAMNEAGEKIYMLAQSYMPAQDIHILVNPTDENLSPWFKVNDSKTIPTPEYLFYSSELKRW